MRNRICWVSIQIQMILVMNGHSSLCGKEDVWEEDGVCVGVDAEGAAEGLEDHAEEVPRVEADQRDQQQVERVPHLVPEGEKESSNDCVLRRCATNASCAKQTVWIPT